MGDIREHITHLQLVTDAHTPPVQTSSYEGEEAYQQYTYQDDDSS